MAKRTRKAGYFSQNSQNATATNTANAKSPVGKYVKQDATSGDMIFDKQLARRDAKKLGLSKADLPNSIKEIIATLTEAGFEAYIVGGGVRDALLGFTPKDFDAVTNAKPNEIKDVFGKRCRIIGRRFQLCHVYSGRDMIEVATFRAPPKDDSFTTDEGMLTRDNVWGDIYQDAMRRDFSINALYYQPFDGVVYDFCGGLPDVSQKTLRLLGDAHKRVEEDPVRLLRALRFKAKLGFSFSPDLEQQFNLQNWSLLAHVSPHRLYDETQKMFTGGYLTALLPLLFQYQALNNLIFFPPTLVTPLVEQVAINTDKRINEGKSINPAFFYAAILWENYLFLLDKFKKNMPFAEAQHHAANKVMDKQRLHTAMPKFAEQFIKDIWLMQPRLAEPRRKNIQKMFENPRFRAAFDFLFLREQVESKNYQLAVANAMPITLDNESTNGLGHWWAWFQTLNFKQQQQAIAEFDLEKAKQRFGNMVNTATNLANNPQSQQPAQNLQAAKAASPKKSRLSEQQQQEKDQLLQLSLANTGANPNSTKQPARSGFTIQTAYNKQPPKAPWETEVNPQADSAFDTAFGNDENILANNASNAGYLVDTQYDPWSNEPMVAKKSSRRRRKSGEVANQQDEMAANTVANPETYDANSRTHNLKSNHRNSRNSSSANSIPPKRQRREPSSQMSVLERTHLGTQQATLTQNPVVEMANSKTVENKPVAKKPRTRRAETPSVASEPKNTAKIPAKRTRKKVVENAEVLAEMPIETVAKTVGTTSEKPTVKRGRKPKTLVENVVAENAEILEVKTAKIPAKRTRKKISETGE